MQEDCREESVREGRAIKRYIYKPPLPLKKPRKFVKRGCPGYKRPGEVKTFTQEEIDAYVREYEEEIQGNE